MNVKKKVGLVRRIAAGVCALFVIASCVVGSVSFRADDYVIDGEAESVHFGGLDEYPSNYVSDTLKCTFYSYYDDKYVTKEFTYYYDANSSVYAAGMSKFESDEMYMICGVVYSDSPIYGSQSNYILTLSNGKTLYACTTNFGDNYAVRGSVQCEGFEFFTDTGATFNGGMEIWFLRLGFWDTNFLSLESYNSSLGYLQDLLCKELYLEDAEYAYDPNYLKKIWTFSNTSTSGLDITDGSYSVRHYQQITVRDTDIKDPVVKEYDMVLMDEFPAESLRYEYLSKDYSSKLETQSGFESLNFWETSILGQFVFTRNYFQLVRTNVDGSVEYGGLVKIDLKGSPSANDFNAEHETTTVTPEGVVDQDGYVGGNMDYIQGSGSDYGEAENDADKNYEDEISSSGGSKDLAAQVENLIAVVMAVPRLIAELFSFLPPWCLDFVGIAFTISIGILVFKLAN